MVLEQSITINIPERRLHMEITILGVFQRDPNMHRGIRGRIVSLGMGLRVRSLLVHFVLTSNEAVERLSMKNT
jgi:hypothetical protein